MQIEISKEVEDVFTAQAAKLGKSVSELLADVLCQYAASVCEHKMPAHPRSKFDLDDYVRRMRAANPHYDTSDPQSIDWQAVKAEGRRY